MRRSPTPLTYQHTCRLPRLASDGAAIARPLAGCLAQGPPWLRPDPGCLPSAPPLPAISPVCPPASDACAHSHACRHRTRVAPFFRGLDRLAVHAGGTRLWLPALPFSQLGAQDVVDLLPYTSASPLCEVPV